MAEADRVCVRLRGQTSLFCDQVSASTPGTLQQTVKETSRCLADAADPFWLSAETVGSRLSQSPAETFAKSIPAFQESAEQEELLEGGAEPEGSEVEDGSGSLQPMAATPPATAIPCSGLAYNVQQCRSGHPPFSLVHWCSVSCVSMSEISPNWCDLSFLLCQLLVSSRHPRMLGPISPAMNTLH